MRMPASSRAMLRHHPLAQVIAIAAALIGCGGMVASPPDASTPDASDQDAVACLTIAASSFDTSCKLDSDCMAIASGTFCSGQPACLCPGPVAINVASQSQYQAQLQAVQSLWHPLACFCPYVGPPRCIGNVCTACGGPMACPDGG
ncbi:MAG TPA: hypothetical protein VLM85_15620 [Polyangiaceae bacterium]|nr:hypothetical protein [Polyangiaceae bacterium]